MESVTYTDSEAAGIVHELVLVGSVIGASAALPPRAVPVALATWTVLGGRSLVRAGGQLAECLAVGDVDGARALLPALCGRDPAVLEVDGLIRAAVESIAENTSDASVAPLCWGAVAGLPGLFGYRAVNTLDAMIGYRNARYHRFGWAAARGDDGANLVPARITGMLIVALAPLVGGRAGRALRTWRRDAGQHPSPNAGVVEAAMAGALGISVGGVTPYRHGVELRPVLGAGADPSVADLRRAVRLSAAVQWGSLAIAAGGAVLVDRVLRSSRVTRRMSGFSAGCTALGPLGRVAPLFASVTVAVGKAVFGARRRGSGFGLGRYRSICLLRCFRA